MPTATADAPTTAEPQARTAEPPTLFPCPCCNGRLTWIYHDDNTSEVVCERCTRFVPSEAHGY